MFTFQILQFLLEEAQGSPLIYSIIMEEEMELKLKIAFCNHKVLIVTGNQCKTNANIAILIKSYHRLSNTHKVQNYS
jgi:hypothetical protein